ncbi:MAG: DUF1330 domain-containing protein [Tannerellaceae bacterium]|nr:DUF1330 domain-containing protein [Tannerellaceae bacterium]
MAVFFIVNIEIPDKNERDAYDEYIAKVKPIVESYGGVYIVRSETISLFAGNKAPDRIIIIQFETRELLDRCFSSEEYTKVKDLRESTVKTSAFIVE